MSISVYILSIYLSISCFYKFLFYWGLLAIEIINYLKFFWCWVLGKNMLVIQGLCYWLRRIYLSISVCTMWICDRIWCPGKENYHDFTASFAPLVKNNLIGFSVTGSCRFYWWPNQFSCFKQNYLSLLNLYWNSTLTD